MQHELFEHSPPQTTLTQNKWIDTRKVGRDDAEIKRTRLLVESERKRKRKKDKPFVRSSAGGIVRATGGATGGGVRAGGGGDAIELPNSEISALTQSEVLEAVVHESSDDGEFATKLISLQNTPK